MTVTAPSSSATSGSSSGAPAWFPGFQSLEVEHRDEVSLPVEGTAPPEIAGTLYRNGPARHEVYGDRYRHWWDGDGMVHGLRIEGGRVGYRNRFVDTAKKRADDAAGRRIHASFGTPPPGGPIDRIRNFKPGNTASVNVVHHAGRLLALTDGGRPHQLDPETLETLGGGELSLGLLTSADTFTAHPKLHPDTGDLIGYGMRPGPRPRLKLYRITATGEASHFATLGTAGFVHDFALTATKAVFAIGRAGGFSPAMFGFLLGRKSVYDSMSFEAGPADIWTVDLATGTVECHPAPDGLLGFSHVANAFDTDDGGLAVDYVHYPDVEIIHQMTDVMAGRETDFTRARAARLEVSPTGATTTTELAGCGWEFPRCIDDVATREHTTQWGVTGYLGSPVRIDDDGTVDICPLGPGEFAGEPIPVPKRGATAERDAWILTVVMVNDGGEDAPRSELRILDGADLQAPAVAVARLPNVMPFDFHGSFVPAT